MINKKSELIFFWVFFWLLLVPFLAIGIPVVLIRRMISPESVTKP